MLEKWLNTEQYKSYLTEGLLSWLGSKVRWHRLKLESSSDFLAGILIGEQEGRYRLVKRGFFKTATKQMP